MQQGLGISSQFTSDQWILGGSEKVHLLKVRQFKGTSNTSVFVETMDKLCHFEMN